MEGEEEEDEIKLFSKAIMKKYINSKAVYENFISQRVAKHPVHKGLTKK